jgi:hypothetical protein
MGEASHSLKDLEIISEYEHDWSEPKGEVSVQNRMISNGFASKGNKDNKVLAMNDVERKKFMYNLIVYKEDISQIS